MATLTEYHRVAYIPTPKEIAAQTAKFRAAHLKKKRREGKKEERAARLRQVAKRKRAMTKGDICNVEPADFNQLLDAVKLLTTAASHEQQALDQQARWTVAGKEVE